MNAQPTPATAQNTDSRALTLPLVLAQVAQNVLGGLGAGVCLATLLWLLGVDVVAAWKWPAGVAIITTGAATAWRAWIDEYRAGRNWTLRELDHAEEMRIMVALADRLEAERNTATIELNALRSRNAWLEARDRQPMRINGVPQAPEDDPAHKDAVTLIQKRYGQGVPVTARHMMSVGWPQARYTAALDVLRSAGIVEVSGTRTTWTEHPSPDVPLHQLYSATPIVLYGNTNTIESGGAAC